MKFFTNPWRALTQTTLTSHPPTCVFLLQRAMYAHVHQHLANLAPNAERTVFLRLLALHGANVLCRNLGHLYEGGFATGPSAARHYKQGVLRLLGQLKDDAVALVDTVAPTDFVLNSPLGMADGQMYRHLEASLQLAPGTYERAPWWRDVVQWQGYAGGEPQAKL